MNNGPISVSAPGQSLVGALGQDITFSTRFPFHKLDSTNPVSFQVISILLNHEPPNPPIPPATPPHFTTSRTLIYSFRHGYNYIPSSWFLISDDNFATSNGFEGALLISTGNLFGFTVAVLNVEVDDTNVNIYVDKNWYNYGTPDNPPNIIGTTISIRAYIFVEDLSGNMVPAHA